MLVPSHQRVSNAPIDPRPSATIIASLALSTFAATGGIVAAGSPTAAQPTVDRAALEELLANDRRPDRRGRGAISS